MKIPDWPIPERPREKLIAHGPSALSDAELLAIWLRVGRRGLNAVELARHLLRVFGSLRALLSASSQRLQSEPGIGLARYAELQAALELARRHHLEALKSSSPLSSPELVRAFLLTKLRDRDHEVFCCLYLDNRNRLLSFEELFNGTIDGASVHPREVVKRALHARAAAVIFAHNHPSGVAEPSRADEMITRRLKDALSLVDIRVIDHLVVGDVVCVSLAERGLC